MLLPRADYRGGGVDGGEEWVECHVWQKGWTHGAGRSGWRLIDATHSLASDHLVGWKRGALLFVCVCVGACVFVFVRVYMRVRACLRVYARVCAVTSNKWTVHETNTKLSTM